MRAVENPPLLRTLFKGDVLPSLSDVVFPSRSVLGSNTAAAIFTPVEELFGKPSGIFGQI